ncbi:MAG: hypothetical protein HFJ50_08800 [Clostridia bacterium]|jgi:hypothetical protein|nr:hypothetical protein [Clostridia bacterium]
MGNVDVKKIIIAVVLILILGIGIFFAVKAITSSGKSYSVETIKDSEYKYFLVYSNEKYGVLNEKGEMIIENIYKEIIIPNPTKAVFICKKENNETEVLNDKKEKIFTEFKKVEAIQIEETNSHLPYEKSVLKYEESGKYGLIDFEGKIVAKPVYQDLTSVKYKEGEILAKKDSRYGVISSKGKVLIPFEYEEIIGDRYYNNGYQKSGYIVKTETDDGYKYGYINYKWKKMLDMEYTGINRLTDIEGDDIYLAVAKNGQYGLIKNKKQEIDFGYQSITYDKDSNTLIVRQK